ncbi:AarF/ABC1/UbiB kinase family protein [Alcanivorax sp. DP30]|uniref:ABC1 kinase family protein n=1 Tax=Alcanivorax sp. DP30 TaxID=2606217 RepID=UPI00136C15BA|nr:AarF/ABC1/UbiB kinase family protein [Alcanivorax sp. DP30]MZR61334.1 AarF/ABC1/UbiB kinase family protein [Alcanivorax sp. DP30]
MADSRRRKRPTTTTGRLFRLTGMTTSIATRVAGHQVKGLFQSDSAKAADREKLMQHIGKEVAATLGEMKGAVMKVGQIASQMQDILPREISEQLKVLQNASAPMPFHVIRRQLERELGNTIGELFASFEETPFAAASIGQVHRATTHEGDDVVVKIQYPAVKESIDSDMKHLRRILRLGSLLKVDEAALDGVFREIRNQLEEELDYHQEASNLNQFREFHQHQPWLIIPTVYDTLSSEKVLTLSLETGTPLEQANDQNGFDQTTRNLLGERLFDAIGEQIFRFRTVHCDPHPGNFAFRPDGSIVMYDFGAVKRLPGADADLIRDIVEAALQQDWGQLDALLQTLGARKQEGQVSDQFYATWIEMLLRAFSSEPFDFASSHLHTDIMKQVRKTPLEQMMKFQPSPRTLLIERVVSGHYWTLMNLGVNAAFRPNLEKALNGSNRASA